MSGAAPPPPPASLSLPTKLRLAKGLITTGLHRTLLPRTSHAVRLPENPRFMSAEEAVKIIPDEAVLALSGLGGNQSASTLYTALVQRFQKEKKPQNLTLLIAGGFGARGRTKGSSEDLGVPGLINRFFVGHAETFKKMLVMADSNQLEIQILPQGLICLMVGQQANITGPSSIRTFTGERTFVDPRCGRGTRLAPPTAPQWVKAHEDGSLTYSLPAITCAILSAPAADAKGNIYSTGAAVFCESWEIAKAARRNGGKVIVQVGALVKEGYGPILIPENLVDAVVVHSNTEQTVGARYSDPGGGHKFLTTEHDRSQPVEVGLAQIQFVNRILRVTPNRSQVDQAMARLAGLVFARAMHLGMSVDIGTGLPEQAMAELVPSGILQQLLMIVESGVVGGVPCPGAFFGASVNPEAIISSAELFQRVYRELDCVVVGALEFDKYGNVNSSKRGNGCINYVGPGGFIDLTTRAKICIFCCSFFVGGNLAVDGKKIRVVKPGKPKLGEKVDEVTFSGPSAVAAGKSVFYVTHLGVFQLTSRGVELITVMPGCTAEEVARFVGGNCVVGSAVETAPEEVVTGINYEKILPAPKPSTVSREQWLKAKL